jgi:hypothetical protein
VVIQDFYDHEAKLEAAAAHIDANDLLLDNSGMFSAQMFDASFFDVGRQVDLPARLSGLFVDWMNGAWNHGLRVDGDVLARRSRNVQLRIEQVTALWT